MDHWNLFNNPSSEPTMVDFNRGMNSNPPALNRYNSMNGHSGGSNSGMNSMSASNMGPYGSSMNASMSGSNPSMNLHNGPNPHSSMNINPYGNSSMNSYNSGGLGTSNSGLNISPYASNGALPNSSSNSSNSYNLNTSMPPPPGSQGPLPSPNGFQQPQRNRYSYYDQPSNPPPPPPAIRPGGGGGASHNSIFPPPPPPSAAPNNSAYYSNSSSSNMYGGGSSNSSSNNMYNSSNSGGGNPHNMYQQQQPPSRPTAPPTAPPQQQSTTNYYSDNSTTASNSSSSNGSFPPIGEFKIGTFTMGANGVPTEQGPDSSNRSFSGPTTNGSSSSDNGQNVRETGIIEKLLQTYGFIQCCERQARLFFHFSQFDGNTDHLRIGDPVEFEVTFDRRTGKPIASTVQKISPEVVLSEERVIGAVTTELHSESSGGSETQGRISYENRGECFFLPYGKDDVEGYVTLKPGDKVSFQMATNQRTGNLAARHVRLENPVAPVRYQGVVSAIKDAYGFIERADVVDEIFFHVSETKHIPGGLKLGDDVDFCITTRNAKEVAIELVKLQDGSVVFEDTSQDLVRGQVLKTVERSPRHNPKEPLPGRIRYRGKDRSEVEVKFGERDQRGEFTLRHGDWVEFNIATDRRDRLQKATNITLLDESFTVSGERREHGVVHLLQEECGYILCCDRDLLLHFHYRELLTPTEPVSIGDELAFTLAQDSELTGSNKQTATRIAHLPAGTVTFEVYVQENLQGQLSTLAEPPAPLTAPATPGSVVPPKEVLGTITYLVEGQRHSMDYAHTAAVADLAVGDKVMFSVYFSKRLKKLIATKVSLLTTTTPVMGASSAASSVSDTSSTSRTATSSSSAAADTITTNAADAMNSLTINAQSSHNNNNIVDNESSNSYSGNGSVSSAADATSDKFNGSGGAGSADDSTSSSGSGNSRSSRCPTTPNAKKTATAAAGAAAAAQKSAAATSPAAKPQASRQVYQGYVAALKESFGFVETVNHDKEIFFHFSNVENGDSSKLELGDEVEYSLSSRTGPGGKVSAENIHPLPKNTLPTPKVLESVYNGLVIRPIRSSNPDQTEYCGLLAVDTDDVERSEQYKFGITGVVNKRELLQKSDTVTFQVDETGWATNITAVRKKLIATVDTVKGQYGFLNYEAEEGKKLFFHQTEVKDKAQLSPGDEVEFVIITNQKTGKSSACSIARIMPVGGQSRRPQRLISQLKTQALDQSKPRIIVARQPRGPEAGTIGFTFVRNPVPALLV